MLGPMMIRLFHCDDSDAMRLLVREQFAGHERVEVVGGAHDPSTALHGAADVQPDVVLLDLLDPEHADALVIELRAVVPAARIAHGGADAYVEKSAPFDVLERAVLG